MPLNRRLVHQIAGLELTGELPAAVNGAAASEVFLAADLPPLTPLDAPEPLDRDLKAENKTYPFAAHFAKETLRNLVI